MWPADLATWLIDTTGATEPGSVGMITCVAILAWLIGTLCIPAAAIAALILRGGNR